MGGKISPFKKLIKKTQYTQILTDKLKNDHHVNKNSTFPILSSLPTYHRFPLHTGFSGKLKIWFIFK